MFVMNLSGLEFLSLDYALKILTNSHTYIVGLTRDGQHGANADRKIDKKCKSSKPSKPQEAVTFSTC